jgi:hypothetical protein
VFDEVIACGVPCLLELGVHERVKSWRRE